MPTAWHATASVCLADASVRSDSAALSDAEAKAPVTDRQYRRIGSQVLQDRSGRRRRLSRPHGPPPAPVSSASAGAAHQANPGIAVQEISRVKVAQVQFGVYRCNRVAVGEQGAVFDRAVVLAGLDRLAVRELPGRRPRPARGAGRARPRAPCRARPGSPGRRAGRLS